MHIGTGIMSVPTVGAGAVENSIYELAAHLVRRGLKVDIIDIKNSKAVRGNIGAVYHEVKIPALCDLHPVFQVISFSFLAIPRLYSLVKDGLVDIIHTHSQFSGILVLVSKIIFRWNIPLIYTTHNSNLILNPTITNKIRRICEYLVFRFSDKIIALTETIREKLIENIGINPQKITQIHIGIEMDKIEELRINSRDEDYFTVLYPARVCSWKNQMALLEASIKVLKEIPNTRFIIAGPIVEKGYFTQLVRFVKKNRLESNIKFTGELPREKIYKLYGKADVVAFPTLMEVQPVALLEAMAFGVPVVASNISQIRDIIKLLEGSALLVSPYSSVDLGRGIVQIIRNESLQKELSYKGRRIAQEYFSWDIIATKTANTYQMLIRKE